MKKYLTGFIALMLSVVALQATEDKGDEVRVLPVEEASFISFSRFQDDTPPPEETFAPEETKDL